MTSRTQLSNRFSNQLPNQLSSRLLSRLTRFSTLSGVILSAYFLSAGFVASTAIAKDYIVEVIVFENMAPSNITEPHAYQAPKKPKTQAQAWLLDTELLNDQAKKINADTNYQLKHHFAWGQEALPYSRSATYTVVETDTQGYIKIYAEQLLFANIDIDYKGFRMVEKRRLKLNEKHYFDHPKFGLLLQVSRLEEKPQEKLDETEG